MKVTPHARLLLVELVCDLLIFALCCTVCLSLLVRAKSMSRESRDLTNAVYLAQSALEARRSAPPAADAWSQDGYELQLSENGVTVSKDGVLIYALGGDGP